jgi:hypothetical protein
MVKVCIEKQLLPVADMLVDIFKMRMAEVGICGSGATKQSGGDETVPDRAITNVPQLL